MTYPWWLYLTLVACMTLSFCVCLLSLKVRKQTIVQQDIWLKRFEHLEEKYRLVSTGAIGLGHRLLAIEARLQTMQEPGSDEAGEESHHAYTQAMNMIAQGIDSDTVATACGLSQSEVNLMALMNKQKQSQNAFAH